MNKRTRQYIGLLSAILSYYIIHEGSHFLYALILGVFKGVNISALGVQIGVYAEHMTELQMGTFCLLGSVATATVAYVLVLLTERITAVNSKAFKACLYYITMALLFLDPLYLSLLCSFVGGGDMNGIALLVPELGARIAYGILLLVNGAVFLKTVLPKYKKAFAE